MKTEIELAQEFLLMKRKIQEAFPELLKCLSHEKEKFRNADNQELNNKPLVNCKHLLKESFRHFWKAN